MCLVLESVARLFWVAGGERGGKGVQLGWDYTNIKQKCSTLGVSSAMGVFFPIAIV